MFTSKWKCKTQVTSSNLRVTSSNSSYKFKSTSYEFKSTSYEFKFMIYEFKFTSQDTKSTSCKIKSKSWETEIRRQEIKSTSESNETTSQMLNIRVKGENSELKMLNSTSHKKLYFHCLMIVELRPHTKALKNLSHNMALKNLYVIRKLPTHFSIGHNTYVLNGWPQAIVVGHFLWIGWVKYIRASPPARKMQLFSSDLNMQNSAVMFTFSNFDRKYHFWATLVQKIKIVSLI